MKNMHDYQLNIERQRQRGQERRAVEKLLNWDSLETFGYMYKQQLAKDTGLSVGKVTNIIEVLRSEKLQRERKNP